MADFIKQIKFNKDFLPFKGGDKIFFGGEKQVQDLVRFYLKSQGKDESFADRIKINCILGNNGGGKSRLFEYISEESPFISIASIDNSLLILDDFFIFGRNFGLQDNCNNYLYQFLGANIKFDNPNERHIFIYNFINIYNFFFEKRFGYSILDSFLGKNLSKKYFKPKGEKLFKNTFIKKDIIREALGLKEVHINFYKDIFFKIYGLFNEDNPDIKFKIINTIISKFGKLTFRNNTLFTLYELEVKEYDIYNGIEDEKQILTEFFEYLLNELELTIEEEIILSDFLSLVFNIIDIEFNDDLNYTFNKLSAGEKLSFLRFSNIYMNTVEKLKTKKVSLKKGGKTDEEINKIKFNFTILIDEPDLHLHLEWQKKYIQKLIDVFSTLPEDIKVHFIIATHSPFIISDLPNEAIVVLDGNGQEEEREKEIEENGEKKKIKYMQKFTEIKKYENKTFGANFVDLIRDGFFFEDKVLMGSFAEEIIGNGASFEFNKIILQSEIFEIENQIKLDKYKNKIPELRNKISELKNKLEILNNKLKIFKNIKNKIGDDFLRDNLIYFKGNKNAKIKC